MSLVKDDGERLSPKDEHNKKKKMAAPPEAYKLAELAQPNRATGAKFSYGGQLSLLGQQYLSIFYPYYALASARNQDYWLRPG